MSDEGDELTAKVYEAVLEPSLIIQLDHNWLGGQNLLRLLKPGPTRRSNPVPLLPFVIVGEAGMTHATMLRNLAEMMDQAGRGTT